MTDILHATADIDRRPTIACASCGQGFTIIENWPIEHRCPPCQAQWRIDQAVRQQAEGSEEHP